MMRFNRITGFLASVALVAGSLVMAGCGGPGDVGVQSINFIGTFTENGVNIPNGKSHLYITLESGTNLYEAAAVALLDAGGASLLTPDIHAGNVITQLSIPSILGATVNPNTLSVPECVADITDSSGVFYSGVTGTCTATYASGTLLITAAFDTSGGTASTSTSTSTGTDAGTDPGGSGLQVGAIISTPLESNRSDSGRPDDSSDAGAPATSKASAAK